MNLDVTRKTIPDVLSLLKSGEWQVPKFQREFVWTQPQVLGLLTSIFKARPIGMVITSPNCRPELSLLHEAGFQGDGHAVHLAINLVIAIRVSNADQFGRRGTAALPSI